MPDQGETKTGGGGRCGMAEWPNDVPNCSRVVAWLNVPTAGSGDAALYGASRAVKGWPTVAFWSCRLRQS